MPRKGRVRTIARGIYEHSGGFEVRIVRGGVTYSQPFPPGTSRETLTHAWKTLRAMAETQTPRAARGTLRADVPAYLELVAHLATVKDIAKMLEAWCVELGDRPRADITARDVLLVRNIWLKAGRKPKTVNNRVQALRNLYKRLDGKRAPTPCDEVDPLHVQKTPIQRVSDELILRVDHQLQRNERDGRHTTLKSRKTRARFRVFVSTGKRPCEIMRAKPQDVDLEARIWVPRDAKGGFCPGVYLNEDMLAAWKLFIDANAWGRYNHAAFARTIRTAGWPAHVRPYQARHTTWITARERGVPLEDVSDGAGHTDTRMTKRFYTGILNGPLQRMSETLDGRFQGWPAAVNLGPDSSPRRKRLKKKDIQK
jgi:integrase